MHNAVAIETPIIDFIVVSDYRYLPSVGVIPVLILVLANKPRMSTTCCNT